MLVCAWVCVCVCATPRSHCHYRGEACEHTGHMTGPCGVGHTQNGNMQNTMQRVQHRNLCRHCLCLFVHGKFIFNPAGHVLLRFIPHYYTLLVQPFIRALQICQVHSTDCLACHQGCIIRSPPLAPSASPTSFLAVTCSSFSLAPSATLLSRPQSQPK